MSCCMITLVYYAALSLIAFRLFNVLRKIVYPFFIASPISDLVAFSGANWAVVTGGTDGIGKAYAIELARKGFNIVLISRSQSRLDATKKEIEEVREGLEVKAIAYDFTDANVEHYQQKIANELNLLEVGVMVNNVGMAYEYPAKFDEFADRLHSIGNLVVVNTLPITLLSAIVLKQMSKRNKGIVINISSAASMYQIATLAAYSASKKYVDWLSAILRREYAGTGIFIQTVNPMFVATKLVKAKRTTFFRVSPETFARSALRTVGIVSETTGCFQHEIQIEYGKWLPNIFLLPFLAMKAQALRAKALEKLEREARKEE